MLITLSGDHLCQTTGSLDSEGLCHMLLVTAETLHHRDDALLCIAYVMLIWAAPIPADRWHCSLWPYLTPWVDWHAPQ